MTQKKKKRRLDKRVWENPKLSGKRLTVRTPTAQLAPGRVKRVDKARQTLDACTQRQTQAQEGGQ